MQTVRVVALFDLPPNVFAETGVNTTLVVGYKPKNKTVSELLRHDYSVFTREIERVGYEKRTSNRNIVFEPKFLLDLDTFETVINTEGESTLAEDFSKIVREFREWCLFQETELKRLFLD
jgi:type I restriction enzyme M protein